MAKAKQAAIGGFVVGVAVAAVAAAIITRDDGQRSDTAQQPTMATATTTGYVLTLDGRGSEIGLIVIEFHTGGHMGSDGALYNASGNVIAALCQDGFLDNNPPPKDPNWTVGTACGTHGGRAGYSGPPTGTMRDGYVVDEVPGLGSLCEDGTVSESVGSGTCSHHDGIALLR